MKARRRAGKKTSKGASSRPSGEADPAQGDSSAETEQEEAYGEIYRQVGKEILDQRLEPAAWARALAECGGTRDEALTHYVRHRAEILLAARDRQVPKVKSFESRRLGNFRDFHSLPIVTYSPYGQSGPMSLVDALFWHTVAIVGMIGCLLALGLVWPGLGFQLSWKVALAVVLAMQVIPIVGWWFGQRADRTLSYSRVTQMAAMIAMISSVMIGVRVLSTPSESGKMGLYREEVRNRAGLVRFPGRTGDSSGQGAEDGVVVAER